ncbi:metallophosphoesterase family protein [Elizabethkingia anophelis]
MKRRKFLAKVPLAASALMLGGTATNLLAATQKDKNINLKKKLLLTVAHITDVHLPADPKVMERFVKCLKEVKTKKVDFFLNTGDSIMAVDRDNSTRQEVYDQWNAWDSCIKEIADYDMYSCVGNHDIWWPAENQMKCMVCLMQRKGLKCLIAITVLKKGNGILLC